MEVANKARSTESLVIRVCGLSSSELEELAAAQGDLNRWWVVQARPKQPPSGVH